MYILCQEEIIESDEMPVVAIQTETMMCCHLNKVWHGDQCPFLRSEVVVFNLKHWRDSCKATSGCNAVHCNPISLNCVFRGCPSSIPEPTSHRSVFMGCAIPYLWEILFGLAQVKANRIATSWLRWTGFSKGWLKLWALIGEKGVKHQSAFSMDSINIGATFLTANNIWWII